jgi:uncharacterized protein YbbC (DUF1343 family)
MPNLKVYVFALLNFFVAHLYTQVITGAEQVNTYINLIKSKNVALVVNQTSTIGKVHLVDSLLNLGIKISCIFAPEHGFRGNSSAGTTVSSGRDEQTGLKIISLYGNHKKPTSTDLQGVEYVIFDIQDVGVRYYTYISTMHYVMEACAEKGVPFMVLDRPNPNGHYVDGPVLDTNYQSFVGMHPIPLVHGCTVAELAQMINGESWLKNGIKCQLKVISCKNYAHSTEYTLPIQPSPNLQTQSSIYLYPSLGLFEGTTMSLGHGTNTPYQCFGSPALDWGNYNFIPKSIKGVSEHPKNLNIECTGFDLTWYGDAKARDDAYLNINWLILAYRLSKNKSDFFTSFIDKLAGSSDLRNQIKAGKTALEIRKSWENGLNIYKTKRLKYLIYQ